MAVIQRSGLGEKKVSLFHARKFADSGIWQAMRYSLEVNVLRQPH
jgi:hypothetical protein